MPTDYVLVDCISAQHPDVLLVLKDRPDWQKGRLNLPGGKIEDGESPEEAAVRELKEETGYDPACKPRIIGKMIDGSNIIYCLKAVVLSKDGPQRGEGETEIPSWYWWHEVLRDGRLLPNLKIIVPMMRLGVEGFVIRDGYRGASLGEHFIILTVPDLPC